MNLNIFNLTNNNSQTSNNNYEMLNFDKNSNYGKSNLNSQLQNENNFFPQFNYQDNNNASSQNFFQFDMNNNYPNNSQKSYSNFYPQNNYNMNPSETLFEEGNLKHAFFNVNSNCNNTKDKFFLNETSNRNSKVWSDKHNFNFFSNDSQNILNSQYFNVNKNKNEEIFSRNEICNKNSFNHILNKNENLKNNQSSCSSTKSGRHFIKNNISKNSSKQMVESLKIIKEAIENEFNENYEFFNQIPTPTKELKISESESNIYQDLKEKSKKKNLNNDQMSANFQPTEKLNYIAADKFQKYLTENQNLTTNENNNVNLKLLNNVQKQSKSNENLKKNSCNFNYASSTLNLKKQYDFFTSENYSKEINSTNNENNFNYIQPLYKYKIDINKENIPVVPFKNLINLKKNNINTSVQNNDLKNIIDQNLNDNLDSLGIDLFSSMTFRKKNFFDIDTQQLEEKHNLPRVENIEGISKLHNINTKEFKCDESEKNNLKLKNDCLNTTINKTEPNIPNKDNNHLKDNINISALENQQKFGNLNFLKNQKLSCEKNKEIKNLNFLINNNNINKKDDFGLLEETLNETSRNKEQIPKFKDLNKNQKIEKIEFFKSPNFKQEISYKGKIETERADLLKKEVKNQMIKDRPNKNKNLEVHYFNSICNKDDKIISKINHSPNKKHFNNDQYKQEKHNFQQFLNKNQSNSISLKEEGIKIESKKSNFQDINNSNINNYLVKTNEKNSEENKKNLENSNIKIEKISKEDMEKNLQLNTQSQKMKFSIDQIKIPDIEMLRNSQNKISLLDINKTFTTISDEEIDKIAKNCSLSYLNQEFDKIKNCVKYANFIRDNYTKLFWEVENFKLKFRNNWKLYLLNYLMEVEYYNYICEKMNQNYKLDFNKIEENLSKIAQKF